jgi:hypothetical protein
MRRRNGRRRRRSPVGLIGECVVNERKSGPPPNIAETVVAGRRLAERGLRTGLARVRTRGRVNSPVEQFHLIANPRLVAAGMRPRAVEAHPPLGGRAVVG